MKKELMQTPTIPSLAVLAKSLEIQDYRPSLGRSLLYVCHDFLLVFACGALTWTLAQTLPSPYQWALWPCYWFLQGTVFWGIFVLGHDCGHESFSKYPLWNEFWGNVLHSVILVPFWSWRNSHRHHHQNTGHIDKDEPFQPERCSRTSRNLSRGSAKASLQRAQILSLGGIWWPYLLFYSKFFKSHFWPLDAKLKKDALHVYISVASVGVVLGATLWAINYFGLYLVFMYYLVPLFVYASWLVLTTFLHHNDPRVTWLGDQHWTYVKGNLATVDRSYGVFDHLTHHIGVHQIHHLFPFVPHYHLKAATAKFVALYPLLHLKSTDSILPAFILNSKNYIYHGYVEPNAQQFSYGQEIERRQRQPASLISEAYTESYPKPQETLETSPYQAK